MYTIMDINKDYIEMCKKAQEIQKQRGSFNWDRFDYAVWLRFEQLIKDGGFVIDKLGHRDDIRKYFVWLPRQDQLAEMIGTWNNNYSMSFFNNIEANSKYRGIPDMGFNSIEKHLLHFLMSDKFNKFWNEVKKEWEVRT